jgi:hypothetical protein
MRLTITPVIAVTALTLSGCGGTTKTVTQTRTVNPAATASSSSTAGADSTTTGPISPTTGASSTTTGPGSATTGPSSAATESGAESENAQVISSASQASDNQAATGASAVRRILVTKVGLDKQGSFNLNHHITQSDVATDSGDCYVKLGADAVNFEGQTQNILRSPNGSGVVFVQSDTSTPLVKCLVEVKAALGW